MVINQSELGGIYLGTIKGEEIIPRLIQDPAFWRGEINTLIRQLLLIHGRVHAGDSEEHE